MDELVPIDGGAIRRRRKMARLDQTALAAKAGLDQPYVSKVERAGKKGGIKKIAPETLARLARALGVGPEELIDPLAEAAADPVAGDLYEVIRRTAELTAKLTAQEMLEQMIRASSPNDPAHLDVEAQSLTAQIRELHARLPPDKQEAFAKSLRSSLLRWRREVVPAAY